MNELENYLEQIKEPIKTKNIADYEVVELDKVTNIREETIETSTDKWTQIVAEYMGDKMKIPLKVLLDIKHMKANYEVNKVNVMKSGEGKKTSYTVFPLDGKKKVD